MGLFTFLMLVFIVAAVVGYFRGWYRIARVREPQTGKLKFELTFDSAKAREDARVARGRVGEALSPELPKENLLRGTIVEISADPDMLMLRAPNENNVALQMNPATTVRFHDGAGTLHDLHIGDSASISYRVERGRNVAQVVMVDRDR